MGTPNLADGLLFYIVFVFSSTLHEAAHAWAALRGGDDTAYLGGQVSLDPTPHMQREPIGMIVVPLISVLLIGYPLGFASAPYNPVWALRYPKRAALMALAGPGANLILVLAAAIIIHGGMFLGAFYPPDSLKAFGRLVGAESEIAAGVGYFVGIIFSMNLLLAVLNLLPFPPLDGSAIAPAFMSDENCAKYMEFVRQPAVMLIGLVVAWRVFGLVFPKAYLLAVNLLYPGSHYA